jgi:hypothetical protein
MTIALLKGLPIFQDSGQFFKPLKREKRKTMTSLSEKYIPWYPVRNLMGDYKISYFKYTFEGLFLYLVKHESSQDTRLVIYFPGNSVICRIMNESYRGKFNIYAHEIFKDIAPCGPLLRVEHSDYIKSLEDEAGDILEALDFKHYYIGDSEWGFDIASQYQPQVELFIEDKLVEKLKYKSHFDQKKEESNV